MKPTKLDVYGVITDRIINLLEQGTVPWHKTWASGEEMPKNLVSRKEYRGLNVFMLSASCFASPYWVSFKQAKELGGTVKTGEKGTPVIFWNWVEEKDKETGKLKKIPFLRYYTVFNASQCDGIESKLPVTEKVEREHNPIESAEKILAGMPKKPAIKHGLGKAFYSPSEDYVGMPNPETFTSNQDYYSVLFHELTHATGHQSRLNRKGVGSTDGEWASFGSTPYAKEELVAEMGAAFLCGQAGIVERTIDNSAAYIASWLQRLKDDRKLVVQSAAQAQKSSDFILGKSFNTQES